LEYLIAGILSIIAFGLLAADAIGIGTFFLIFIIGIPLLSILLVGIAVAEDSMQSSKWRKETEMRSAKAKATKEKNLKKAIDAYPKVLEELHNNLLRINELDTAEIINFYDKIKEICAYCTRLGSSRISQKEKLKKILIYSRLNILTFYEDNKIDGAEKLAEKVTKIIKKLK
jgi:hypothetical protein